MNSENGAIVTSIIIIMSLLRIQQHAYTAMHERTST